MASSSASSTVLTRPQVIIESRIRMRTFCKLTVMCFGKIIHIPLLLHYSLSLSRIFTGLLDSAFDEEEVNNDRLHKLHVVIISF